MPVLATFVFVCIGSIFFLPDNMGAGRGRGVQPGRTEGENSLLTVRPADRKGADRVGGKVYKVYKVRAWSTAELIEKRSPPWRTYGKGSSSSRCFRSPPTTLR